MLNIPLSKIKKIEELKNKNPLTISLSQGAIKVGGIPQQIKDYVKTLLKTNKTDYYDSYWGNYLLREQLVKYFEKTFNISIKTDQVIITHGCIGALTIVFNTILKPSDDVIISEPDYPAYSKITMANHCNSIIVKKLYNKETQEWSFDIEKIKEQVTKKTKIIVFSNPCNPLGTITSKEELISLASFCKKKQIYLVVDEAYRDFVFEGDFYSSINLTNKFNNVICCSSFSKSAAMSGWRTGYLVANEKITPLFAKMQDTLFNCVNNIGQYAATYVLQNTDIITTLHNKIKQNRDNSFVQLKPIIDNKVIKVNLPKSGFYFFPKINHSNPSKLCSDLIKEAGVSIIPGETFGKNCKQFVRICYAREEEELKNGMFRLINYLIKNENLKNITKTYV